MGINIYQIIDHNMNVVASLDPNEYPELSRIKEKTSVITHLYALMQHMLTYSCPVWSARDRRYFLFSERYLADWNKKNGGTGDLSTWQSHKIFLLHAGLIKTHVVIGNQTDPILQRIWDAASANGNYSETLWSTPLYTPAVLGHAEEIARQYRENRVNLSHIRKNVISKVWGPRTADSLYRNSKHGISAMERYVESCLRKAMKSAVKGKGFTTLDEVQSQGLRLCMSSTDAGEQEYRRIIQRLMAQKRLLIDSAGYEYHPIRKRDRVYEIPEDHTGFIITAKDR